MRLTADFYEGSPISVAQSLLGKLLVRRVGRQRISGIIVEVEAYLSDNDSASHSARGPSPRNASMFAAAGTLYVYTIHAKFCMNVVTESIGTGSAVLIRALEPWRGIEFMQQQRGLNTTWRHLCSGPAKLCQALAIDRTLDGIDLMTSNDVWIESSVEIVEQLRWSTVASPRIGISSATEHLYRFFIDGHACVSGLARLHTQKRGWTFG